MEEKAALYAREARNFVAFNRHAILSTISSSQGGFPFGSVVSYYCDDQAKFYIYVSLIAEHYKNLTRDGRASLIISDPYGLADPQAHARATVLLEFKELLESERAAIQAAYEERFPSSINYELSHNFTFMVGEPVRIRWIGGFGEIGWVNSEKFRAAEVDPMAKYGPEILEHMNDDHEVALRDYVRAFTTYNPDEYQIKMVGITTENFSISLRNKKETKTALIPFAQPVNTPEEARKALVSLVKKARNLHA